MKYAEYSCNVGEILCAMWDIIFDIIFTKYICYIRYTCEIYPAYELFGSKLYFNNIY